MKRNLILFMSLAAILLSGCKNNKKEDIITTGDIPVIHETAFDSIYGDMTNEEFYALGFELGDSVNVEFSNGKKLEDIPFYDGYYVEVGGLLVVAYPGYPHIDVGRNIIGEFWQYLELTENDTMNITLNEKGKYLVQQETFSTHYVDDREAFASDEIFSNFRPMNLSTMKENIFYRGASPVDNQHKRAANSDKLLEQAEMGFVLNLADSKEEVESYMAMEDFSSPYSLSLYNSDKIAYVDLSADYTGKKFQDKVIAGLEELVKNDGPYYVHCTEGKDRTGFVCFLIEALSGASYQELEDDYMVTYANYYGITKESNPEKYQAIVDLRFKDFVKFLAPETYQTANTYKNEAIKYLSDGGMSEEAINILIDKITK